MQLLKNLKNAKVEAREVDPRLIKKYDFNPRLEWEYTSDDPDFVNLVKSIELTGITDRLVVTENTNPDDPEEYNLWYGHRRHAAALDNGLDLVPVDVIIGEFSELEMMLAMSNSETHHKAWGEVQRFLFVDRVLSLMEREYDMEGVTQQDLATYVSLDVRKLRSFQNLRKSKVLSREFVEPSLIRPQRRVSDRLKLLETVNDVVTNLVEKHPTAVRAHYRNVGKPNLDLADERNIEKLREVMVRKIPDYEKRGNIGRTGPISAFQTLKKITDPDGPEGTFAKQKEVETWLGNDTVLREDLVQLQSLHFPGGRGVTPKFDGEFGKLISLLEDHIIKNTSKMTLERLNQYERNWRSIEVMGRKQADRALGQIERNSAK